MSAINSFDEEKLLEQLEEGIAPLSEIIIALLDYDEIPMEVVSKAYLSWAGPASILSHQLRRQGRESPGLKELTEYGSLLDQEIDRYLAFPTQESLNDLAEAWMGARAGSYKLLEELDD